jgi:mRNA-degrading endonuclease RelE of RelBE toxin-antitoxin system
MNKYQFTFIESFKRDYKELQKSNFNLDKDFKNFIGEFEPQKGDTVVGTKGAKKIRMKGKNRGKSGAYRIYYYFILDDKVFLIRMFEKSDMEDLSFKELLEISKIVNTIKDSYK